MALFEGNKMRGLSLILCLVIGFAAPSKAEEVICKTRDLMVESLLDDYGEQLAAVRKIKGEGLLEFHVSAATGTWTALLTKTWAQSCLIASGDDGPVPEFLRDTDDGRSA
jgi:hypothetical protein